MSISSSTAALRSKDTSNAPSRTDWTRASTLRLACARNRMIQWHPLLEGGELNPHRGKKGAAEG